MRRTTVVALAALALLPASVSVQASRDRAAQSAASDAKPGVYLISPDNTPPQRLSAETSSDLEVKGMGKAMLTQGLVKPKQVVRHAGAKAGLTLSAATPAFLFRFPPPMPRNQQAMMAVMERMDGDALPMMSTHPKQFALIRVTVDGDARVIDTGALKKLKLTIAEAGTREFRVTVAEPLDPGEYAFFMEDQGKGGTPAQIWAFTKAGG